MTDLLKEEKALADAVNDMIGGALSAGDTGDTFYISRREFINVCRAYQNATGDEVPFLTEIEGEDL